MYANYFLINEEFLSHFDGKIKEDLSELAYKMYVSNCSKKTKKLSKSQYFTSKSTHYPVIFFYCPKCKSSQMCVSLGIKNGESMKYCPYCGDASMDHRFNLGVEKVMNLFRLSLSIKDTPQSSKEVNQCIVTTLCSVYEVYLREFYADILNLRYVRGNYSLYNKFLRDCKNDFISPGKTFDRFKKELQLNYKSIIGEQNYKALGLLSDYRNVIVHNNGICDDKFISKYPDVERHSQILPSLKSLAALIHAVVDSANKLSVIYEQQIYDAVVDYISERIQQYKYDNSGEPILPSIFFQRP